MTTLYLASQSPRRRQLLEQVGVRFRVLGVDVPEVRAADESPEAYVDRVAREKARAGFALVADEFDVVVLGADTEVVLDDRVFGKPSDADDAEAMLAALAGRVHRTVSAVWCVSAQSEAGVMSVSEVTFAPLDAAAIAAYVASGEAFGRAGAYAIQGRAGAFVSHLAGSYSGVMGLPLHETTRLLARFGIGS
jgi:septum formation protein